MHDLLSVPEDVARLAGGIAVIKVGARFRTERGNDYSNPSQKIPQMFQY